MSEKKEKFVKAELAEIIAGEEILTFSDRNTIRIKILSAINDKAKINGKTVKCYNMRVIDLDSNREIKFNPAATRLNEQLFKINKEEGLINQTLRIEKIGSGMGTHYKVEKIK